MEYLSAAHALDIVTIMNPSPLPTPEQTREFPWEQLTWLIVNEGEAKDLLTSVGDPQTVDAIELVLPSEGAPKDKIAIHSAHTIGSKLANHPTFKDANIICTLGSVGLVAFMSLVQGGEKKAFYLPSAKFDGPVVDTTGAGDCFTGYFVSGLMDLKQGHEEGLLGILSTSIKVRPSEISEHRILTPQWGHTGSGNLCTEKRNDRQHPAERRGHCMIGLKDTKIGGGLWNIRQTQQRSCRELNPMISVSTLIPPQ
jgi:sugar/nucleoside kinase (ribokinase family)